jgi:hypothetical protein
MTRGRGILSGCLIIGGFIFFFTVSKFGELLLAKHEKKELKEKETTAGEEVC